MPRSKNLSNYDDAFWDLRDAMTSGIGEIKLDFAKKRAINIQQSFYAFIRAHEHTGNGLIRQGKIDQGQELIRHADTMRGYLVQVTDKGLHFINRELNPTTPGMKEQIQAQLATAPTSLPPDTDTVVTPTVAAFFSEPLEIKSDLPGDNEEV